MRLKKVDDGHTLAHRLKLRAMQLVMRRPPPDILKALEYRPGLWGKAINPLTQAVLRGPSSWSVADRELLAAFVSSRNQCGF